MKYRPMRRAHHIIWEGNLLSYKNRHITLDHGRELLGLSLPQMAMKYSGFLVDVWLIFEFNEAVLPRETRERIEADLR